MIPYTFNAFIISVDSIILMISIVTVYFVCERKKWYVAQYAIYITTLVSLLKYTQNI